MKAVITIELPVSTPEVHSLMCKIRHRETKTILQLELTRYMLQSHETITGLQSDIGILKQQYGLVSRVAVMAEGTRSIGRIVNRLPKAMSKVGLEIESGMDWGAVSGMVVIKANPLLPFRTVDLPYVVELMKRLVLRSLAPVKEIQTPFTIFDLKQAAGLVYDAKNGNKQAGDTLDWCHLRELVINEEDVKLQMAEKEKEKNLRRARAKRQRVLTQRKYRANLKIRMKKRLAEAKRLLREQRRSTAATSAAK